MNSPRNRARVDGARLVVREVEQRDEGELVAKRQRAREADRVRPEKALAREGGGREGVAVGGEG